MLSSKIRNHFENKVIWVTGASSGIGRALVIALSSIDCHMFITSRSQEKLKKTIEKCDNRNNIEVVAGDLTSKETNQEIIETINRKASGFRYRNT